MRARWLTWPILLSLAAACSSPPPPRPDATHAGSDPAAELAPAPAPAPAEPAVPALPRPDFLRLVPADTPFFFGALSPLPPGYAAHEYVSRLAAFEKIHPAMERLRRQRPKEMKRLGFLVRLQVALLGELGGAASAEKLAAIGLDPSTVGALYGLGMNPVVRVRLSDPVRFAAALGRMMAKLEPVERAALGGQSYYVAREDAVLWILAVSGGDLVIALVPPAGRAAALPLLFGQRVPERSLADDRRLDHLAAEYGFSPIGLGYADLSGMAISFGGALAGPCAEEVGQIAAAVPRAVVGLASASGEEVRARSMLETRSDLAGALMNLRGEVPSAEPPGVAAPLAISAAVDLRAVVAWLSGALAHMAGHPFRCPALAWLNDLTRSQGATLRQAGRVLANVRGASVAVRNLEGVATGSADFFFLFGSQRPGELLGQLAGALGAVPPTVDPGDPPVELASPLGSTFGTLHVALGRRAVGLSIGADGTELAALLSADVVDDPPLIQLHVDPQAVGPILRLGSAGGDPRIAALDPELARNLAEIEVSALERFDEVRMTVRATPRGLEVGLDGRYPR